jgi:hypothetical protein
MFARKSCSDLNTGNGINGHTRHMLVETNEDLTKGGALAQQGHVRGKGLIP